MTNAFKSPISLTAAEQFNEICQRRPQPLLERVHCALGPINDYRAELRPQELATVSSASAKRQLEFAAGRHFARRALVANGSPADHVTRGDSRQPLWPPGLTGSISHSSTVGWAAVASVEAGVRSLGIDLELRDRVPAKLREKLFLPRELQAIDERGADFATWLFSAKEAIYKATNPLTGRYIGFTEAECVFADVQNQEGREASGVQTSSVFTARYLGDDSGPTIMATGQGYVRQDNDHVYALFLIPTR